jgi:hypothetical protein
MVTKVSQTTPTHLQHFKNNYHMQLRCSSSKNQTWFITNVLYDVYKLLYKRPIFNSFATIIQLIDFLT